MLKILIIDSHSVIHRAYHALPPFRTKKGELVNAVYGFLLVFFRAIKEIKPDFVTAVFDLPGPTFRHKEYDGYKAGRPVQPKEFYNQVPIVKKILSDFRVPVFEKQGFEADDVIGTISCEVSKKYPLPEVEKIILTSDLDILQLIDERTRVWTMKKGVKDIILCGIEQIKEKYDGLLPSQLPDFRGLKGDPSDNIPGVRGIGEKGAINLIKEFGNLENLYNELESMGEKSLKLSQKIKELLKKHKEESFFSRKLSQIQKDVPIDFDMECCRFRGLDKEEAAASLKELGFLSLANRLP